MNRFKYFALLAFAMMSIAPAYAQQAEMADAFRAEGKIYVVIAFILIVLTGVFIYLFLIDRKVKRLEERLNEKHQTK